jgi:hypothetical protein
VQSRPLRAYKRLLAACLFSLFLSTGATVFFYRKWSDAEDWYRAERASKDTLRSQLVELQIAFDKNYNDLSIMHNENYSVFFLNAVDSTKRYFARVYWNRFTRETFLDVQNLPKATDGRQFQLWAYTDAPVNAGVVILRDDRTLIPMRSIEHADKWALTLEPSGGSLIPDSIMCLVSRY